MLKFLKNIFQKGSKFLFPSVRQLLALLRNSLKAKFLFCSQHRIIKINLCRSGSFHSSCSIPSSNVPLWRRFYYFARRFLLLLFFQELHSHTVNYYCMVKCAEKGDWRIRRKDFMGWETIRFRWGKRFYDCLLFRGFKNYLNLMFLWRLKRRIFIAVGDLKKKVSCERQNMSIKVLKFQ